MKTITAICLERQPGYPDPLIYTLEVDDKADQETIVEAFFQSRIDDLGENLAEEVRETFEVVLAWEGDFDYRDVVLDYRL